MKEFDPKVKKYQRCLPDCITKYYQDDKESDTHNNIDSMLQDIELTFDTYTSVIQNL